ncbi:MAG: DUF4279 domain-containing protein [Clostridia bacterium]|nr:DUF4279 domain-containing protein [Clostridia bacterium]
MSNPVGEGRFSLVMEGNDLPAAEIEQKLGIKATRVIRKGDVLNRLPLMTAETDEWAHTIELTNAESTDTALNDLLAQIIVHTGELKAFAERGIKVQLRMYVQSDYAQMSYRLMPETLSRLVATGLPLEVSSMSWGELGI